MKALIVAPAWIGDTVMAQTLFKRLLEQDSTLELDALAPPWVAPVLQRMPEIRKVIDNPFAHGQLAIGARFRLAQSLKRHAYQRAYLLPNSLKSSLIPFFAGIAERIGFTGECRYGLVNFRHTLDPQVLPLMHERFAQLAEPVGKTLSKLPPRPRLTSTLDQQSATLTALGLDASRPLVIFCPGAEYGPAKRWPARHFALLAEELAERGYAIQLLGSSKDKSIGDEIIGLTSSAHGTPNNLCGWTSLTQAIDLIAASAFVVCNDSGLMHVAAALERPLIALYGSSSPGFTPPLTERARILRLGLECSPCFKRECPLGHLDCLNRLLPETVLSACMEIASGKPAASHPSDNSNRGDRP